MKKFTVTLTKDERDELERIASKGKHKSQKVINALILVMAGTWKLAEHGGNRAERAYWSVPES